MYETDFLVIGSGIAALSFSLKIAEHFKDSKITIITKEDKFESNTKYAQGGIAIVNNLDTDSFDQHIKDTLIAGDGLCDEAVVEMVIKEGPALLDELIDWGVRFDESEKGRFDLGKEGGHSQNRILHYKDITGYEIIRALLKKAKEFSNLEILENHFAIDLITEHHKGEKVERQSKINCFGVYAIDEKNKQIKTITSKVTMLAAGGIGQVYRTTTNPEVATGDGVAMAYRAKAELENMEFIQFHPTALYELPPKSPAFLISEAVRGFGAYLKNKDGVRFMSKYDSRLELAPRDIVARAIDAELKLSGESYVFLDCRHLEYKSFREHFPNILEKCLSVGIDVRHDLIPVTPAAHYLCGGIKVDKKGRTSINNLYACGECSSTGLHGANRLASNSLLEAIVYSHKSFLHIKNIFNNLKPVTGIPEWDDLNTFKNKRNILITHEIVDVKNIMSDYVGIVRSDDCLIRAEKKLKVLYEECMSLYKNYNISKNLCELRNLITVAYLITQFSIKRKENAGGFFNVDNH
ncbi:L-aspartate oxidase [Tenacibaculum sp. UWU-22]|uniref:L-aspartate oxidase n=1 Tax=Tenacibaculum sp. UWU-22 TaxID=3234187 RepID=UPI0034DB42B1